ncbi:unnamed protein product [Ceratitis capitata]|uniref:(Mediterranean fruit fly) hypothetical protein n=1 Tax=Ceratitis capitata TaxID=7213 RepID=A0A811V999_CERCA|nr:unnamed protein product [Ceratitis capitata]
MENYINEGKSKKKCYIFHTKALKKQSTRLTKFCKKNEIGTYQRRKRKQLLKQNASNKRTTTTTSSLAIQLNVATDATAAAADGAAADVHFMTFSHDLAHTQNLITRKRRHRQVTRKTMQKRWL